MINESSTKEVRACVKKKDQSPSEKPKRKPKSERKDSPVRFSSSEKSDTESDGEIVLMTSLMTLSTRGIGASHQEFSPNIKEKARRSNLKEKAKSFRKNKSRRANKKEASNQKGKWQCSIS